MATALAFEQHFRVNELASLWGIHRDILVGLFRTEPGVVKVQGTTIRKRDSRPMVTLRIPASVAERVHRRLSSS